MQDTEPREPFDPTVPTLAERRLLRSVALGALRTSGCDSP
ncbi:hypothetical protein C882_4382 [Caenispirillum salinarum AK4]|uniref:Uncharacterized protein n=1 Tax=Caenispirillum salinarum AK4 TaxID=1238182 RepID=K9HJ56_9PROT|nr:hypothetical protein C882_4382 [Caenispirillum salinarum AK4]